MTDDPGWWRSGPTRPVRVDGGIKARSARGAIGQRWWSVRFIEVLESLGVGGRLGRGRSYARAGQVTGMDVAVGSVTATVQGSRPEPYRVRIGITTYGKSEWAQVEQAMADSAWYAAKLLAGEMPQDIEDVFGSVGLTLFPAAAADLSMDCTCPDRVVPCKHLAAVCYLLAESFDDDPFGILAVRGRDRETLLANIRSRREPADVSDPVRDEAAGRDRPLADSLEHFYESAGPLPVLPAVATVADAVLAELPDPGISVRGRNIVELVRPAYRALARPQEDRT
ncbi:MAG TPA: SWIM zinc finger family protein [Pseudonocardia sp.]|jgi:uncharacterized Zn finger protein|nr:SWIM zinc finger family protein [Pseudonocardia sp.]